MNKINSKDVKLKILPVKNSINNKGKKITKAATNIDLIINTKKVTSTYLIIRL